jgi:hypothetical protein
LVENRDAKEEDAGGIRLASRRSAMSLQPPLSAEQEAEAQRIFQVLKRTSDQDLMALARLLASKPDRELLGKTEFEVRDRVHEIGAKAMEAALEERKKGGTKGRA